MSQKKSKEKGEHYEVNIENIRPDVSLAGHNWQGQGTKRIVCTSCPYAHSHFLKNNQRFVGISKDGLPMIEIEH